MEKLYYNITLRNKKIETKEVENDFIKMATAKGFGESTQAL
jgi:hypothetical protein